MDIAVVGPGAIGGTIATWLAQNKSNNVHICCRTPLDSLQVTLQDQTYLAKPKVHTSVGTVSKVDWVVIAVKTYDCAKAMHWLPHLLKEDTHILVLQNGVEHIENFSGAAPKDAIIPCIVDIPCERSAAGKIIQRRAGSMLLPDSEKGNEAARLFAHSPIETNTTTDFVTAAWSKLCINSAGAVSAITLKPNGIVNFEPAQLIMRKIVEECVAVGRKEGAKFSDDMPEHVIRHYLNENPDGKNSLLADRETGRQMEIHARNGVIVERGRKHGIEAPCNEMIAALLSATGMR